MAKKRDYKREYREYHASPKQKKNRAHRNAARARLESQGRVKKGDGKDIDHKNRNPRDNSPGNLRVTSQKKNRGWRKGQ